VGDPNGDGWLAVVAGNEGQNAVHLNAGTGHLDDIRPWDDAGTTTWSVAICGRQGGRRPGHGGGTDP
jgi:hypothetical protein